VSLTAAGFLAFGVFHRYGVMSIPAGFLVERFTEKRVMALAFLAGAVGSLSFAVFPGYRMAIISYFTMGAGMAVLQVAINPLLRVAVAKRTTLSIRRWRSWFLEARLLPAREFIPTLS